MKKIKLISNPFKIEVPVHELTAKYLAMSAFKLERKNKGEYFVDLDDGVTAKWIMLDSSLLIELQNILFNENYDFDLDEIFNDFSETETKMIKKCLIADCDFRLKLAMYENCWPGYKLKKLLQEFITKIDDVLTGKGREKCLLPEKIIKSL